MELCLAPGRGVRGYVGLGQLNLWGGWQACAFAKACASTCPLLQDYFLEQFGADDFPDFGALVG